MRLLLTNDDGILSPVLQRISEGLSADHDLVVVAPSLDQSGKSHSFTHGGDAVLRFHEEATSPYPVYRVDGTPSDCVKFAIAHLFKGRKFDAVISGINLGENAGVSAVYSGTVAAAREAALWNVPALALSIWKHEDKRLEYALSWLREVLRARELLPRPGELYNINFPACEPENITGVEVTSMSEVMFNDSYEPRTDAHGITGYRLLGTKPVDRFRPGTDDYALSQGRIAVTPLRISQDTTDGARRLTSHQTRLHQIHISLKRF